MRRCCQGMYCPCWHRHTAAICSHRPPSHLHTHPPTYPTITSLTGPLPPTRSTTYTHPTSACSLHQSRTTVPSPPSPPPWASLPLPVAVALYAPESCITDRPSSSPAIAFFLALVCFLSVCICLALGGCLLSVCLLSVFSRLVCMFA